MPNPYQHSGQPVPKPTGDEVERFQVSPWDYQLADMKPHPHGQWVRYEDCEKLKRENGAAVARYNEKCEELRIEGSVTMHLRNEVSRLENELAELKSDLWDKAFERNLHE
jgi:hypothetical protein